MLILLTSSSSLCILMLCILCGNDDFRLISKRLRNNIPKKVISCTSCSLTFIKNFDADLVDYDKNYREKYSPVLGKVMHAEEFYDFSKGIYSNRIKRIKSLLRPSHDILEIGCATGYFLDLIREQVSTCTGIELDKKYAKFAREKLNLNIYDKPIEKIKFRKKFDTIFLFQVLEHIPNPIEFLKSCKKILKKNGRIYIEVPNLDDALYSVYQNPKFKEFYFRAPHLYYYNKKTLSMLMKKGGFVGQCNTIQEYSVFNHIHWIQTGMPQKDTKSGYSSLTWNMDNTKLFKQSKILKKWFDKINCDYKKILEQNDLAEHVSFLGKNI